MNGTRYYMKDEVPFQDFPAYTEKSKGRSRAAVAFLVLILLVAAGIGSLYFLGRNRATEPQESAVPTNTQTVIEEPTATPTPTPDLDRSDLTVNVLNGSGERGAAGRIADILRKLGYTIGAAGNADNFNYEGLTVVVSKENEEYLDLLKSDLEKEATGSAVTASVSATLTADAQVIVGK